MRVFRIAYGDARYPKEWEVKLGKVVNEAADDGLFYIGRDYSIGGYELLCTFEYDTESNTAIPSVTGSDECPNCSKYYDEGVLFGSAVAKDRVEAIEDDSYTKGYQEGLKVTKKAKKK